LKKKEESKREPERIPEPIKESLEGPEEEPLSLSSINFEKGFPSPDMFRIGYFDQGIKHLFDKEKIEMIGRNSPDMVQILRRLRIIAKDLKDSYKIDIWGDIIQDFIAVGLSEKGLSREETLKMVEAMNRSKKKDKLEKGEQIEPGSQEEAI
jgi:hypothetical protein